MRIISCCDGTVYLGPLEDLDELASLVERLSFLTGVDHQGAATPLLGRDHHFAAFRGQHARRRCVHAGEQHALHATPQQPYAPPRHALRF